MHRFYVVHDFKLHEVMSLPDKVTTHINVLRLKLGEMITLFNGDGHSYSAKIIEIAKRNVKVEILEKQTPKASLNHQLYLGICLIAQDKLDLIIQKAVELGVSCITLIDSERSQRIKTEKYAKKMEHWNNIIISSCEQCGQNVLPKLNSLTSFEDFITGFSDNADKFIFSLHGQRLELKNNKLQDYVILIGPEGGFTPNEEKLAVDNKFLPVLLGNNVLRAETAAISALAVIKYLID